MPPVTQSYANISHVNYASARQKVGKSGESLSPEQRRRLFACQRHLASGKITKKYSINKAESSRQHHHRQNEIKFICGNKKGLLTL